MAVVKFSGRCLCGGARYEVSGDVTRFYHCHCQRCRKASGTGHASNVMVKPGTLVWLQGEENLRYYKVPEAERFTNCFCSVCGGRLPRWVAELQTVVIPAGSLDTEPPLQPHARIFWESRAAWSCSGDGLAVFATEYTAVPK